MAAPVIVLVEPQGDRNIGSVCRVMRNFGFNELRLVKPRADHLSKGARDMAVKEARLLLRDAAIFPDLPAAVADCQLVIGSSRRLGKYRQDFLLPADLASLGQGEGQRLAMVFGREDHGLTTAELDVCTSFVTIPSADDFPSLNLAQAVGICLYELSRSPGRAEPEIAGPAPRELASSSEIESMVQHLRVSLTACGYLDQQNPDHILHTYRRIFSRAGLDQREVKILHGLAARVEWLTKKALE